MNVTRHGLWAVAMVSLALLVGCGDSGASVPRGTGGTGGTGASGGVGATGGTGTGGMGGMVGTGGEVGTGGIVGTGGTGGTGAGGGTGGSGGAPGPCNTSALCHTCPTQLLCDTDDDCFGGYVCVDSDCDTLQGAPIKQCQPSRGGSCATVSECPNSTDYECKKVGAGSTHCVRVTAGCDGVTESYDCPFGFSCESNTCVDRRVPCNDDDLGYLDCPKNHICRVTPTASFCVRTHQTCHRDEDCAGLGEFCADIDGDGSTECAGEVGATDKPCVNAINCGGSTPVCEAGATGITAVCGDYGLCLTNDHCDTGFECVGLWQDGRKECVPIGETCPDPVTLCPLQQVCASPRNGGGAPSCQAGSAP